MKVIIVGGGIIGCATALALSDRGVEVVICERGELGAEASSVAAGILGAQVESHDPDDTEGLLLRVRARDGYAPFAAMLTERTGLPTGYSRCGVMAVAASEGSRAKLERIVLAQTALGLTATMLDLTEQRARAPLASPSEHGAAFFPHDAQVEPRKVVRALVACLELGGVQVHRAEVTGFTIAGETCRGVSTTQGNMAADAVVVCTGAFTSLLAERSGVALPVVVPVRGHIVTLKGLPPAAGKIMPIVFGEGGSYVVPRADGTLVCGTTVERVGFSRGPTAAGIAQVIERARGLCPGVADALFVGATAGFRPFREEGPVVQETATRGLFVATGHHRNGILLTSWTADQIAQQLSG
jgi:glycine oxidase